MSKLLALLVTTAFAGIAQAETTAPTGSSATTVADHAKDATKAVTDHAAKTATDHAKGAVDQAKDAAKGAVDQAKDATKTTADHAKDAKAGDHAHGHPHKHHGHHHHHHHKHDTKPAGQDMMNPQDKTKSVTPNLGDSEHAPTKTNAWGPQNKTGETVKPASWSKSNDHSMYQDWWSREHRDQGKGGLASPTPGSPDGEMSK